MGEPKLMTALEVKELLRVDKWGLYKLKKKPSFPREIVISHKNRLFNRAEINHWLDTET